MLNFQGHIILIWSAQSGGAACGVRWPAGYFWAGSGFGVGVHTAAREFFSSINKTFIKSSVVWQLVRQLVYTMFITNNRPSFHLW